MRALSNVSVAQVDLGTRHRKTTAEVDTLIIRQHELDRLRSPSKRAFEVNVNSRTVKRTRTIYLLTSATVGRNFSTNCHKAETIII